MRDEEDDVAKVGVCCCGTFCLAVFIFWIIIMCNIINLGPEEQLLIVTKYDRFVYNGPDNPLASQVQTGCYSEDRFRTIY